MDNYFLFSQSRKGILVPQNAGSRKLENTTNIKISEYLRNLRENVFPQIPLINAEKFLV